MATEVCSSQLSTWNKASLDESRAQSSNQQLWSRHAGYAICHLLHNAGYSEEFQHRALDFFTQVVAPYLGTFQGVADADSNSWHSFITDHGSPIELSWDWGTGDSRPLIRYSIEPIGVHAGTSIDPHNLVAGSAFLNHLSQLLPGMKLEWFHHFKSFFDYGIERRRQDAQDEVKDHDTSICYAFDLGESEDTPKVYFFPRYRAIACRKSNLEVIAEAIAGAPYCTEEKLRAATVFYEFSKDTTNKDMEYEMLAIDLIDPSSSRLKVYFRSRETSFDSVRRIMTLGGRIQNPRLAQGLDHLHDLWNGLFGVCGSTSQSLTRNDHRTAGILYNVEFKLGDSYPVAKIYLPVRHYATSDLSVMDAMDRYFRSHERGNYINSYRKAMTELL
ncbi:aromatic prenyltransferase [Apiospora arundinis]